MNKTYVCNRCGYERDELPLEYNPCDYGDTTVYETLISYDCACGGEYELKTEEEEDDE